MTLAGNINCLLLLCSKPQRNSSHVIEKVQFPMLYLPHEIGTGITNCICILTAAVFKTQSNPSHFREKVQFPLLYMPPEIATGITNCLCILTAAVFKIQSNPSPFREKVQFPLLYMPPEIGTGITNCLCFLTVAVFKTQSNPSIISEEVQLLLVAGANSRATDNSGKTALDLACQNGLIILIDLVIKAERFQDLQKGCISPYDTLKFLKGSQKMYWFLYTTPSTHWHSERPKQA